MKQELQQTQTTSTPTLNPSYVMKKISINKDTVKDFEINEEERRMLRMGKVKEISSNLTKGIHFSSPFVVNERNGKMILIDGNHRYEAIKLKLSTDKDFEVNVWTAIYKNLTKEHEREVFKLWNIGTTQSATDFLKLYFKTIPYGNEMLKVLPITIYGDDETLGIKLLVGSHIMAKKQAKFFGGYGYGKEQTISDFCDIDRTDILVMKEFCNFMEEVFGKYHRKTNRMFYSTSSIPVFYRIWYDNNRLMDRKKLIKVFKKGFASNPMSWKDIVSSGSRNSQIAFYSQAISHLNRISKSKIYSDMDLIE